MNIDIIGNFATRAEAEAHAARLEAYAERKHANPAAVTETASNQMPRTNTH